MDGIGDGLGALAFWGFITALVLAGAWDGIRKREAQHETLRRLIESGKPVDPALMEKLVGADKTAKRRVDRDLHVAAILSFALAAGLVVLGLILARIQAAALHPTIGVAGLVACLGVGLLVASSYLRRSLMEDDGATGAGPAAD